MNYRRSRVAASVPLILLVLLLYLALLGACSSQDDQDGTHSFRVFDENGITVAETLGGPKYEGELFEYVPVLTLEPGDTEETMLLNPSRFTGDSEGWFYVSDTGNGDIVVFDPEGRFHTRFGRKGFGPGEFQLVEFLCTVGNMLYIYDWPLIRTTRFRRGGELVDMISAHQNTIPGVELTALIPLPGEERLLLSSWSDGPPVGFEGEGNGWCNAVRLTTAGDTVWSWSSDSVRNSYPLAVSRGGRTTIFRGRYPYSPHPQAWYVPDLGVVAMTSYAPYLDIINLDGRLHRRIRIDMGDLSVTEEDRKAVFDYYDQIINNPQELPDRRIAMEGYRKALKFTEQKAPWTDLTFFDMGYLFLKSQAPPQAYPDPEEKVSYIVISPDGEYLGITKPPRGRSMEVAGGRLLVNYSDQETGEFTLTVYEMRPIVEGLEFP